MILKKLTIENFGKIKRFEASFDSQLAVISDSNADEIIKAIGLVTNNKVLSGRSVRQIQTNKSYISAELEINNEQYLVNARGQPQTGVFAYEAYKADCMTPINPNELFRSIRLCEEEEELTYFCFNKKNAYAERFLHYKDPDKYYSPGEFQKLTDGLGITRSFRAYLTEYIREYEPDVIPLMEYKTDILSDGRFIGYSANSPNTIIKLEDDNIRLFDYMCYLDINDFWDGFEEIRDMNHEKWPMIIDTADLANAPNFNELLIKSCGLQRQLILKGTMELQNNLARNQYDNVFNT